MTSVRGDRGRTTLWLFSLGDDNACMRSKRQPRMLLRGQIVFVQRQAGAMVLDCLLSAFPGQAGNPITVVVRSPDEPVPGSLTGAALMLELCRGSAAPGIVMKQLRTWAEDGVPIVVEVPADERPDELRIKAWDGELLFHPHPGSRIS